MSKLCNDNYKAYDLDGYNEGLTLKVTYYANE
jgi:hypothetical protein